MKNFRYKLEKYKGRKTRYTCPQCKKPKVFTRYIDSKTGNQLPEKFGICNRINKCSYHLSPYKSNFAQEVWKNEQKEKTNKTNKTNSFQNWNQYQKNYFFPKTIFKQSLKSYKGNNFINYLISLFGEEITQQLIKKFHIGTSSFWKGSTVFWLINRLDQVAGGQVVLFDNNGNTYKEKRKDGSDKRYNTWVHYALMKNLKKKKKTIPNWLKNYISGSPKFPCLFGLPQLQYEPKTKPIAIVESAKTAIIATVYLPEFIWMSVGALNYLNEDRLKDIKNRKIILFPDKGAFNIWKKKAQEIQFNPQIIVSDLLEKHNAIDKSDLADYLVKFNRETFQKTIPQEETSTINEYVWTRFDGLKITTLVNEFGYPISWG